MKFKNQKHRLFNKKAGASVGAAIKVLTSVVLGAAMLAGTYGVVKTTVVPTAENKVSSMFEVADTVELSGGGGVTIPDPVTEIKRNGVIPEGGTYTVAATSTVFSAGDSFPETPARSDTYEEGDYIYKYNLSYCPNYSNPNDEGWGILSSQSVGWGVRVKDTTKTAYGKILSEIAGKPVTNISATFYNCTSITDLSGLVIPSSATGMYSTFSGCTSLTNLSGFVIPDSVTDMSSTFRGCTSLADLSGFVIPSSVTEISGTFRGCTSLTDLSGFAIPDSVTKMSSTFENCTSLTTAPIIPSNVTKTYSTFYNCTSLTGTIEINASPKYVYTNCFYGTVKPIIITGSSTMLSVLASTANNGNVTVAS